MRKRGRGKGAEKQGWRKGEGERERRGDGETKMERGDGEREIKREGGETGTGENQGKDIIQYWSSFSLSFARSSAEIMFSEIPADERID